MKLFKYSLYKDISIYDYNMNSMNSKIYYNICFDNDMGHIVIKNEQSIPNNVAYFAYEKMKNKIRYATDIETMSCRFFILIPGLQPIWTYYVGNVSITLDYSHLDTYDSRTMMFLN